MYTAVLLTNLSSKVLLKKHTLLKELWVCSKVAAYMYTSEPSVLCSRAQRSLLRTVGRLTLGCSVYLYPYCMLECPFPADPVPIYDPSIVVM